MRFVHMRSEQGNGSVSVGYLYTPIVDHRLPNNVVCQVARCNPKDNFSRKKARLICEGRMDKYGPVYSFRVTNPNEIVPQIIREYHPDYGQQFMDEPEEKFA